MHHNQEIYEEYKLLSLLSEDSEYAFQLIYDRHRNRIYQTAIRYLKSPSLGQEVVQDVFLKLWFERKNLKVGRPIEAWLFIVARNNILNRLKKIANEWKALDHFAHISDTASDIASDKIESAEYSLHLKNAIAELPLQQQKVFQLARNEKLTYIQIGEQLNISPLTVKTHMTRALQHIRAHFFARGIELPLTILFFLNIFL
ncbi:MAG: RNA polymerase sigma-70 factor [Chitinophagaceae bacterium]